MLENVILFVLLIVFIQGFREGYKNSKNNPNRKKTYWSYRDKSGIGFGFWD